MFEINPKKYFSDEITDYQYSGYRRSGLIGGRGYRIWTQLIDEVFCPLIDWRFNPSALQVPNIWIELKS